VTGLLTPERAGAPQGSSTGSTSTGPTLRSTWLRGRGPVAVVAGVALVGATVGLLTLVPTGGYLDPDSFAPDGSRAVVELLRGGGVDVERVGTVQEALQRDGAGTTLLIPRPGGLAGAELEELAGHEGPIVVVAPSDRALEALALPAEMAGSADVDRRRPGCGFEPAQRAGDVDLGGLLYAPTAGDGRADGAVGCYATGGDASLLVLPGAGAVVLGNGDLLTNDRLDDRGNAALALALLGAGEQVSWLVPDPARQVPEGEQRPLTELLPAELRLAVVQLAVVVAVLALWRARRLGRVVEEPLPVVVRASEAVEGRGRLYRAAGARDRAAEALRAGTRDRLARRLGLPPRADRQSVVPTAAARTGRDAAELDGLLYGAPPADDAALVRLADALRGLERAVADPPAPRATAPDRSPEVAGP
jgi:hypothetical protein